MLRLFRPPPGRRFFNVLCEESFVLLPMRDRPEDAPLIFLRSYLPLNLKRVHGIFLFLVELITGAVIDYIATSFFLRRNYVGSCVACI